MVFSRSSKDPQQITFKEGTLNYEIEQAMNPNENGLSRVYTIEELELETSRTITGNGCLIRDDGRLGNKYIIQRNKEDPKSQRVTSVQLKGWNAVPYTACIPKEERKKLAKLSKQCVICGSTSKLEIDHKDGRKKTGYVQYLCKSCNGRKREICKKCKTNGIRFHAKELGYSIDFTAGHRKYDRINHGCEGCYYYDPNAFNQSLILKK